ncbi:MAG: single-stranded DNA-binding protein [Candidatus Heimdallarchaeota archaeon]
MAELEPYDKRIDVTFKVISKGEMREITNRRSQETHTVCDITVGDATASIILTLWNEDIDAVSVDSTYKIKNGYINIFHNSMRLAKGKYGELVDAEDSEEISEVNNDKNRSDEEHQRRYRERRYDGGGGGGGYGGGGGRGGWGGGGGGRGGGDRNRRRDRW